MQDSKGSISGVADEGGSPPADKETIRRLIDDLKKERDRLKLERLEALKEFEAAVQVLIRKIESK